MRILFCKFCGIVSHEHFHLPVEFSSEHTVGNRFRSPLEVITLKVLESKASESLEYSTTDPAVSLSRYFQLTCA